MIKKYRHFVEKIEILLDELIQKQSFVLTHPAFVMADCDQIKTCCKEKGTNTFVMCIIICIPLAIIAMGMSIIVIYMTGMKYTSTSNSCPVVNFPQNQDVVFTKDVWSQLHWRYVSSLNNTALEIIQKCPTYNHDAELRANGELVSRTDYKTFTFGNLAYINDCHGDRLFTVKSSGPGQSLLNIIQLGIQASLIVENKTGDLVGYVVADKFYSEQIQIIDSNTNKITVNMNKYFFSFPWKWVINIYDNTSVITRPELLVVLAGHLSFMPQPGHNDTSDICNTYFMDGSIVVCVFTGVILVIICYVQWTLIKTCYSYCREKCTETHSRVMSKFSTSNNIVDLDLNPVTPTGSSTQNITYQQDEPVSVIIHQPTQQALV